jgi:segregation and condensation protein B
MTTEDPDDGGPRAVVPAAEPSPPPEVPALEAALVEDLGPVTATQAPVLEDLPPPPDADDLPPGELRGVIEALLVVATKPLSVERLAACAPGTDPAYLEGFLVGLAARWTHEGRGFELRREAKGWQLMTRPRFHPWVRQLERRELPTKLSRGALETLAVVAYKQPVARGAIEDIRGVQCGPVLRQLMDLKLVAVTGRDDQALGRPLLYGTTDQFLVRFGLGSPADLPKRHEFGA